MADEPTPVAPADLPRPQGYAHGMVAPPGRRLLCVAGQIGWDRERRLEPGLPAQFRRALENVLVVVREAGGGPADLLRLTVYVVDREEYRAARAELGAIWRELVGRRYPAMSLVEVAALLEDGARLELEATAAVP